MDATLTQKEKISLAKKKLRKFQQKSARLEKNTNGSLENDAESQVSQHSDVTLHQQTIDILVEEKAELLKSRDGQGAEIQQLKDDISVMKSQLHSTNSDYSFSEKKRSGLQSELNSTVAENKNLTKENGKLVSQVSSLHDQLTVLQTEVSSLSLERSELNERLSNVASTQSQVQNNMSSVPNPFKRNNDVVKLEDNVTRLTKELEDLKITLVAKETQCDTLAGRLSHQETLSKEKILVLEARLNDREDDIKSLQDNVASLTTELETMNSSYLEPEDESVTLQAVPQNQPLSKQATEKPMEKHTNKQTKKHLDELQEVNGRLQLALEEQIVESLTLRKDLDKFKETHVNQNTLLTQINNDKATISRAMGQNKQLKEHLLELQDKLMKTCETNASLANEVQELSSTVSTLMAELAEQRERDSAREHRLSSEDSILEGTSSRAQVLQLQNQLKDCKDRIASIQQEKAILGLSAAQVDSVKAMNIALQEKVASLSKHAGKSENEIALEQKLERVEKQFQPEAVEKRIQDMLTSERLEREKQREFLDRYYEEQLREQIGTLEERISSQTKQFKQYVTEMQTSHEDEVSALRSQLAELQQNFRSSLQTQYTQLVQYFIHKGASDIKAREEELHAHYMTEISRLYNEMTREVQKEEIRQRKRTQSDEISVITVGDKEEDWELERECLKSTLHQLEDEIVKIEVGAEDDSETEDEEDCVAAAETKEERRLQAHVRVLEMQLSRSNEEHDRTTQRYKQEIVRQSQVIQKLHMYLATQNYDSESEDRRSSLKYDSEVDNGDHADNVSITSAGQFQRSGDMTATKEETAPLEKEDDVSRSDMKINMDSTENEFETKLKYLASKSTEGGEYVLHMQKLQDKFSNVMKDNANLVEKLKDAEYQNILLEGETDTIGEYISLYQSQRQALRMQFQQKDDFINKLLNERSDMQAHIGRLQLLITELPCVDDIHEPPKTSIVGRQRSDSISSNISTLSIMSTTKDEMLEIIGKLRLRTDHVPSELVTGPVYSGSRGPVKNI